jgi:hypothetical protein
MIAFEGVAAPIREPFTETLPDSSGAGQTVVAPTRVVLAIMSTTGVAELCNSITETLDWNARAARRQCRD